LFDNQFIVGRLLCGRVLGSCTSQHLVSVHGSDGLSAGWITENPEALAPTYDPLEMILRSKTRMTWLGRRGSLRASYLLTIMSADRSVKPVVFPSGLDRLEAARRNSCVKFPPLLRRASPSARSKEASTEAHSHSRSLSESDRNACDGEVFSPALNDSRHA
jgi:hypothetical protein